MRLTTIHDALQHPFEKHPQLDLQTGHVKSSPTNLFSRGNVLLDNIKTNPPVMINIHNTN